MGRIAEHSPDSYMLSYIRHQHCQIVAFSRCFKTKCRMTLLKVAGVDILYNSSSGFLNVVVLCQIDFIILEEKWTPKYPNSMKRWKDNWDVISPIFKFSATVRKVIYTTNAIESLNSTYRKLNRQRSVFPSDTALLKALYLATFEATKKWTSTIRNWGAVYGELSIMYEGRLPE